jgi:membrane fusion protein
MSLVTTRTQVPAPQKQAPSAVAEPLFSPEVMEQRRNQWLGTVLLEPRISSTFLVTGAMLLALAVLALLFFGSFTRKARVHGWLVPQQGLVRIFAPQAGVAIRMQVQEGMHVEKGTPLVVLSAEVQSDAIGATQAQIIRRLHDRRDSVAGTKEVQDRLFDQQTSDICSAASPFSARSAGPCRGWKSSCNAAAYSSWRRANRAPCAIAI